MIWQPSTGIWTPPQIGPLGIPPSPPAEQRIKREREVRRQNAPIRCPGIAPVAWREFEQIALPMGIHAQRVPLKPMVAAGPSITAPTSFWRFEEASGNRADTVGSDALVPSNTPGNAAGKIGNAVALVATSSQSLSAASSVNLSLNAAAAYTIGFWAYPVDETARCCVLSKGRNSAPFPTEFYVRTGLGTSTFQFAIGDAGGSVSTASKATAGSGVWQCVVCVFDGVNQTVYVNNVGGTPQAVVTTRYDSTNTFFVGTQYFGGQFWDGRIDAMALWNGAALGSTDRTNFYNGTGTAAGTEYFSGAWH